MKRVVMISNSFHPMVGGAERQILKLATVLVKRGIDVEVVTRSLPGCPGRESRGGVRIRRIPVCGGPIVEALVFVAGGFFHLWRGRGEPLVVHAHSLSSPATIAALCKIFMGAPTLVKIPGGAVETGYFSRSFWGRMRIRALSYFIDYFIPVSNEVEQEMLELSVPLPKIVKIANGVEMEAFVEEDFFQRDVQRHSPLVAYVGRLEWVKGVDILIEAWRTVAQKIPDALLLLVGSGSQERALKESASEYGLDGRIVFAGEVSDPALYFRNADIVVLPSRSEGLSNTLLEAMSMSVPVVASAVGGTTDIVTHKINGILFSPGDSRQLADELLLLMGNEKLRRRIGRSARQTVSESFEIGVIAERYLNLYSALVRKARACCH